MDEVQFSKNFMLFLQTMKALGEGPYMPHRTLVLRGPFSDADITAFWKLMQTMEAKNPEHRYKMVIDAKDLPGGVEEAMSALDEIAPLSEGYARILGGFTKPKRE